MVSQNSINTTTDSSQVYSDRQCVALFLQHASYYCIIAIITIIAYQTKASVIWFNPAKENVVAWNGRPTCECSDL